MVESKRYIFGKLGGCSRSRFLQESHGLLLGLAGLCAIVAFAPFLLPEPGEDALWFGAGHFVLGAIYLGAAVIPLCAARVVGLAVWAAYLIYAVAFGQELFATALVSLVIGAVFVYRTIRLHDVEVTGQPTHA